jgi:penicillin amidase
LKQRNKLKLGLTVAIGGVILATVSVTTLLGLSLPQHQGTVQLKGLTASTQVTFDALGIPTITAKNREDAMHSLGFVVAQERLFQMDLIRRQLSGQLSEILGEKLLDSDRWHRQMGFTQVAKAIYAQLPIDQRQVLQAYADGVNQAYAAMPVLPFEFLLLHYQPEPWSPEDSLLSVLSMYEALSWTGDRERMMTVMKAALPAEVVAYFTPAFDHYTELLMYGAVKNKTPTMPVAALARLLNDKAAQTTNLTAVKTEQIPKGSNAWLVSGKKTKNHHALLANDMHLQLRVPNIWYRAQLQYQDVHLKGFTLPGLPLLLAGPNEHIAWGFTNAEGDFTDLVILQLDPQNPNRYLTANGYVEFGKRIETIHVRDQADQLLTVKTTQWGPVDAKLLLGKPVAIHWTALDAATTDLDFLHLDSVKTAAEAMALFNHAGSPPLNALVADNQGNIAWTLAGKVPQRIGFDGLSSESWSDNSHRWAGYVPTEQLPRTINPASGMIVNANQRMVDSRYPYDIGKYYDNGYRAYRIHQQLAAMRTINERSLLTVQMDTHTEFYRFYQQLALNALPVENRALQSLRTSIAQWDGQAERQSTGLAVLIEFRKRLLATVIAPYMAKCKRLDPEFEFYWALIDDPLQQLLTLKLTRLLPNPKQYRDWNDLIYKQLIAAYISVAKQTPIKSGQLAPWGQTNHADISHPFSQVLPFLQPILDMPHKPLAGCVFCVNLYMNGQ